MDTIPTSYPSNPLAAGLREDIAGGIVKTIRLAALRRPGTPLIVRIIWDEWVSMAHPELERQVPDTRVTGGGRRTDVGRRLDVPWEMPQDLEEWLAELAWSLGGGYLYRWSIPPRTGIDPMEPKHGYREWFAVPTYAFGGGDPDDVIDDSGADLIAEAAHGGYWQWECNAAFRKVEGHSAAMWPSWRKHDPGLSDDGSRRVPWPGWIDDKWLRLAKTFEYADAADPTTVLQITYNLVTRRMDPTMR